MYLTAISTRKLISQTDGVFFITFTCANWLPLFTLVNGFDIVYNWFDVLKSKGHYIIGYVIMSNHLHAIIAFRNTGKTINSIVSNGKRFIAYEIIERLQQTNQASILQRLADLRSPAEIRQQKQHHVFEVSFDWKECRTTRFLLQKLNYMHHNPGKAGLVTQPEEYLHSSATFYVTGVQGIYPITSYTELQDIDLTSRR